MRDMCVIPAGQTVCGLPLGRAEYRWLMLCYANANPYTDGIFLELNKGAPLGDDHVAGCGKCVENEA